MVARFVRSEIGKTAEITPALSAALAAIGESEGTQVRSLERLVDMEVSRKKDLGF
jgi:hypothetical protein